MKLPYPITTYPLCGACERETSHDGDSFVCEPCGLDYGDGSDTERAEYINPGTPPCDANPNYYWLPLAHPCGLPEGHRSNHWHGLA